MQDTNIDIDQDLDLDLEITEKPIYEVWILGYDQDNSVNDFEYELGSFADSVEAVEVADNYFDTFEELVAAKDDLKCKLLLMRPAKVAIVVEEVVRIEPDSDEVNVNTLYTNEIDLEELYKED